MLSEERKELIDDLWDKLKKYTDDREYIKNVILAASHVDDLRTVITYVDENTPPDLDKVLKLAAKLGGIRAGFLRRKRNAN